MNSPINEVKAALRIQLGEANQRSRMYAQRFWQLPFAYISVVGIALAGAGKSDPQFILLGPITLCLMGLIILCIMFGTFRAIKKSVEVIERTEEALELPISVKKHYGAIDWPNFALVLLGVLICIIAAYMLIFPCANVGASG
jgi:TRAP-type C4-dicarboxylate transport system permease small subunit